MKHLLTLAVTDLKLIFRDPSLRAFLAFPFVLFGLVVWFLPGLVEKYADLRPYISVFLMVGVIENTQMFCFISSMVLIDEKETNVAKVYGILPLTKVQFLLSRLLLPFLITVLLNIILLAVQPFFAIGIFSGLAIAVLTALVVPVYVLGINAVAENRMKGMVYVKAFNMLVLIPLAAFFVPDAFSHLFGVLPTHWVFQSIYRVAQGQSMLLFAGTGLLFFGALLVWVSKLFVKRHFV